MDDEKLVYPLYEAMLKNGINTICIHKGLMPADYMTSWADMWQYATVWDVGKAAKDWPQINFVIYHSAMRPFLELPDRELAQFEKTGRFDWVSDLADIPAKFGVNNVYGELGACFANTCVTHPKLAAALMGTLIKGLGEDKVIWGTDSVWWGSPQWQIEAMRRLEIPEDMQKKYGYKPLGAADGPVKTKIFAGNASKLYKIDPAAAAKMSADNFDCDQRRVPGDGWAAEQPAVRLRQRLTDLAQPSARRTPLEAAWMLESSMRTRFRPSCLARYSATSARATSASSECRFDSLVARPALRLTAMGSPEPGALMVRAISRKRSTTAIAVSSAAPGITSRNSSPPQRPRISAPRSTSRDKSANSLSTWSPPA